MATTASTPTGAAAANASEQISDCIIASSNRYYDLLPFCNSLYYAEPQRWGCILPWDFPQSAAKEVEEEFLRKYFTETEIHMQGGAQGAGAGFRFLKQVWYSIALWNYEHRIPAIATWWLELEENSSILEDPTMRDALCNEEVKPETCFNSRDIQIYGTRMLACAVKQIQDRVKAKQALPVEEAQTAEKPRSASDGDTAVGQVNTESASVASPPIEHNNRGIGDFNYRGPPQAASAIVPTNEIAVPFPIYEEASRSKQQVRYSDHGHTAWSAGYPTHQVQGRKRGSRLSSASGGTRGGGYDLSASLQCQHVSIQRRPRGWHSFFRSSRSRFSVPPEPGDRHVFEYGPSYSWSTTGSFIRKLRDSDPDSSCTRPELPIGRASCAIISHSRLVRGWTYKQRSYHPS
jgi:hypothetical protein